jgi:hypothetical protein
MVGRGHDERVSAIVFLSVMIVISLAGALLGVDSRHHSHPADRYWWPNREL